MSHLQRIKYTLVNTLIRIRMWLSFVLGVLSGVAAEQELIWQCVVLVLLFFWAEYQLDTKQEK